MVSARVAKVLMERALTNSISPSIFTSLFMPHPGEPEETGGKALKMKRGPNPVRFSRKGLQNSWKQSSQGFPVPRRGSQTQVEFQAVLPVGLGSHSAPSKGSSRLSPEQQAWARPLSPATASPLMSLQVAPRQNPVFEVHLERAVP